MNVRRALFGAALAVCLCGIFLSTIALAADEDDPEKGRKSGFILPGFYDESLGVSRSFSLDEVTHPEKYSKGYTIEQGVDVSKWNGTLDWGKLKSAGIDFAFIRVANRGYGKAGTLSKDSQAAANLQGAVAAGIPFGVYIFSQAVTEYEAAAEAEYAIRVLEEAGFGEQISLPVVMDFEYYSDGGSGSEGRLFDAKLSREAATAIVNAFCTEVKKKGYTPMVYANRSMLTTQLDAPKIDGQIWVAQYNSKNTYEGEFNCWQYTSAGAIPGFAGKKFDLNFRYIPEAGGTGNGSSNSSGSGSAPGAENEKTYTAYQTTTRVNYRTGAGTTYKIAGTLASGKEIRAEDGFSKKADGYTWFRFQKDGKNYYIASKYIKKGSSAGNASGSSGSKKPYSTYKTTTRVNYRTGAGTTYKVAGTFASGKKLEAEDGYAKKANGYMWYRFKKSGKTYYIAAKYLKKS